MLLLSEILVADAVLTGLLTAMVVLLLRPEKTRKA